MKRTEVTTDLLAAVHHPVRRRIVEYLALEGPSQVGTLARAFNEQVGSVSHHLRMLERTGVVERAPELAEDGRTSWWRYVPSVYSWSVDDFGDNPVDRHRARAAERLNLEHQVSKYSFWKRAEHEHPEQWRRAAFNGDGLARATPQELAELGERLFEAFRSWRAEVDTRGDDADRRPIFWFMHAFPTRL